MNGLVDFSLTEQVGKVAFYTAGGQYTVGDAMFNTSTDNAIRGYMQIADDGRARVGLHDGRMVFSTGEGPKTVNSNEYILLKAEPEVNSSIPGVSASEVGLGAGAASCWYCGWFTQGTLFTSCAVIGVTTTTIVSKKKGSNKSKGTVVTKTTTT
ncbi:hypothetical protein VU10_04805, partial [Desulfobulbus sp. US1]|nr:hypothetical protein [Desulfobulbus sp. US1]